MSLPFILYISGGQSGVLEKETMDQLCWDWWGRSLLARPPPLDPAIRGQVCVLPAHIQPPQEERWTLPPVCTVLVQHSGNSASAFVVFSRD